MSNEEMNDVLSPEWDKEWSRGWDAGFDYALGNYKPGIGVKVYNEGYEKTGSMSEVFARGYKEGFMTGQNAVLDRMYPGAKSFAWNEKKNGFDVTY